MSYFHHTAQRGLITGVVSAALVLAACSAPGGESESASSDPGAGGDKCADSATVQLQDKLKGLSPEEREKTLFDEAKAANDGTVNLYGEVNDPTLITDPFEEKYDGLHVSVYRAGSEQIRERVLQESQANFAGADLIELDSLEMAILNQNHLLAPADSPFIEGVTGERQVRQFHRRSAELHRAGVEHRHHPGGPGAEVAGGPEGSAVQGQARAGGQRRVLVRVTGQLPADPGHDQGSGRPTV